MKMEYPSVVLRTALVLLLAVVLGWPLKAQAGSGVSAVSSGRAADAKLLALVVDAAARESGWTVTSPPLEGRAVLDAAGCLERDRPLPCLAPILAEHGADRLVFLEVGVSSDESGVLRLSATVVVPDGSAPASAERFCRSCKEEQLRAATTELVRAAIRDAEVATGRTALEITVGPVGAWVYLDGEGVTTEARGDKLVARVPTYPGEHVVTAEKAGMPSEVRKVRAEAGEVTRVSIELGAPQKGPGKKDEPRDGSWRRPLAWGLIGAGALAVASGAALIVLDEDVPEPAQPQPERIFNSAPFGTATLIAGAAAAGVGTALWLLRPKRSSGAQVSVGQSGAYVTWSQAF